MEFQPDAEQRYVAFLRAINVGGRNVKMDHLRNLFEALGFSNMATFIASGNVIFDTAATDRAALETQIEKHLEKSLGYEVATFVRSMVEVEAIVNYEPFATTELESESNSLYVAFLPRPPHEEAREKLMSYCTAIDDFHMNKREVYWLCRTKVSQSKFSGAVLERTLGMPATVRNVRTVRRIAAKYATS